MDKLIYDRTREDVTYALNNPSNQNFLKGAYNYVDLNRVEEWCLYIANILNSYNYNVQVITKVDWNMFDFPTTQEFERIKSNVANLKKAYFSFTQVPENLEFMTIEKANSIEKILFEIDKILKHMENNFVYCGVSMCGQNRVWQQRFRRKYVLKLGSSWEELKQIYWSDFNLTDTWKGVIEDETNGEL